LFTYNYVVGFQGVFLPKKLSRLCTVLTTDCTYSVGKWRPGYASLGWFTGWSVREAHHRWTSRIQNWLISLHVVVYQIATCVVLIHLLKVYSQSKSV